MENETLNLEQLAQYLRRDVREVSKLASRGRLPGQKVGGQWRFASAEVNYWLETQMPGLSEKELSALEERPAPNSEECLITSYLQQDCMAVPLPATTRTSVLNELVKLAERSGNFYDREAVLKAVKHREGMVSTALPSGVAIPHPHRPLPAAIGEPVLAYARTASGVPFGDPQGTLTDIFFLVCCPDAKLHLRILARLSRLFLRSGFLDELRAADSVADTWILLQDAERDLRD